MATTRSRKAREATKANRAAAQEAAKAEVAKQEQEMTKLITKGTAAAKNTSETKKSAPVKTRKQMKAEAQAAAEKQAAADARVVPVEPEPKLELGSTPSLHELNTIAKRNSYAMRDEAKAAASAAGNAAYKVLKKGSGETDDRVNRRYRNMGKAHRKLAQQVKEAATAAGG